MDVLSVTLPIFVMISIGFAVTRFGLFRPAEMAVLSRFILYITLPALLFGAIADSDPAEALHPGYLAAMVAGGLATMAVMFLSQALVGTGPVRRAMATMGSVCPNSAFIGYPILLLVLPEQAGPVLGMNLLIENLVMIPLSLALVEFAMARPGHSPVERVGSALLAVLKRPMIVALALGLAVSFSGIELPVWFQRSHHTLGQANAGVALIALGGSLVGLPMRGNRLLAGQIALGKLVLHPLLVAGTAMLLTGIGAVALPPDLRLAAILSAAVPILALFPVLNEGTGHEGLASLSVMMATLASFVTLTLALALLT